MSIQKITTGVIEDSAVTGSKISVGTPEAGDIFYHDGTEYVKLAKGTDGDVLKLEIDFLNLVVTGFWPAIKAKSSKQDLSFFHNWECYS